MQCQQWPHTRKHTCVRRSLTSSMFAWTSRAFKSTSGTASRKREGPFLSTNKPVDVEKYRRGVFDVVDQVTIGLTPKRERERERNRTHGCKLSQNRYQVLLRWERQLLRSCPADRQPFIDDKCCVSFESHIGGTLLSDQYKGRRRTTAPSLPPQALQRSRC
jgi:hypothetical protein